MVVGQKTLFTSFQSGVQSTWVCNGGYGYIVVKPSGIVNKRSFRFIAIGRAQTALRLFPSYGTQGSFHLAQLQIRLPSDFFISSIAIQVA